MAHIITPPFRIALLAGLLLAPPAYAETVLHLAETATVMVAPDEIAATLTADATSSSASDAQARVNTTMQAALAQARAVQGVAVSTGGYGVWRTNQPDHPDTWDAEPVRA